MIIPIELRFRADKGSKSAFRTEKTIKSHDVNSVEFHISIDGMELTDSHTAKILSVFHTSESQANVDCEIVEGKIIYKPDTNLISRHEHVTNYVYVYNGNQSLDVREFIYVVDLSKIDETSLEVKEVYDQSYADLLADFEQALSDYKNSLPQADSVRADIDEILNQFSEDSQQAIGDLVEVSATAEIAEASRVQAESERVEAETERIQAEHARKEAETLREESYEQKVDTAIVEADVVGKVDNKVTELTPQINNLTAQLAQTNKPLRYGPLEMPDDFEPELPSTFYRDNDGIIKHNMDFQSRYKNGTKLYVRLNGNDTTGDGSPAKPFRTMTKAIAIAIAGSDSEYVIITNVPVFNRDELIFNQTVVDKTISFVSENSYEKSSEIEAVTGLLPTDYNEDWEDGNGYVTSVVEGASINKTVNGSDIYLKFRKHSLGGIVEVIVDGKNSMTKQFSTHSDTPEIYEELIFWDLEDGNHQVTITYGGPDPDITYGGTPKLMLHESETFRTTYNDFSEVYKWSKGKTLFTSNAEYTWTSDGVGTYKATRSSIRNVIDLMNIDSYGLPVPLKNAASLAECQSTANTWYSEGSSVWVHRKDGLKPDIKNTVVNIGVGGINPKLGDGGVVYFENFIFTPWITAHALNVTSDSTTPVGELVLNNCLLVGQRNNTSRGNGLATDNIKNVFSFNVITAYAQLDGYNYHYTKILEEYKRDCLALEYNCTAYDLGLDVQGAGSNNASSSHEGASVVRFGTVGYRNSGAVIIDVNGCYSVLYDCHARTPIIDGVVGKHRAYSFTTEATGRRGGTYLINSSASESDTSLLIDSNHTAYVSNFKYDGVITAGGELVWE